jgi:hypothetical protein
MGVIQAALTLPAVGFHSWLDWLQIGAEATRVYKVDENWVHLSRDLLGIPRRYLLDFGEPARERDRLAAGLIGWALLLGVLGILTWVALRRPRRLARATTGPGAGFLLLGGWLCCFHFMYYDVVLGYLPVMLLLSVPRHYLRPRRWRRALLEWERRLVRPGRPRPVVPPWGADLADFNLPADAGRSRSGAVVLRLASATPYGWFRNSIPLLALLTLLALDGPLREWDLVSARDPLDTYCLLALWVWCGWVWIRRAAPPELPAPPGEEAHAGTAAPAVWQAGVESQPVTPAPAP